MRIFLSTCLVVAAVALVPARVRAGEACTDACSGNFGPDPCGAFGLGCPPGGGQCIICRDSNDCQPGGTCANQQCVGLPCSPGADGGGVPVCSCDVTFACDPSCACDPECADGGTGLDDAGLCACDVTFNCDPGCGCDPECGTDASAVDGPAADGSAADGPATDGSATDGRASDGPASDAELSIDGAAIDSGAGDGAAAGDARSSGGSGNPVRRDSGCGCAVAGVAPVSQPFAWAALLGWILLRRRPR
ncbi:MAG: hypothetical protein IT384_00965 [Deltaproteobacteria bacterium]|nr:hypothetical protein [Deltaproteobacteria bacterium]